MNPHQNPKPKRAFLTDDSPSMSAVRFAVQLVITGLAAAIWNGQSKMSDNLVEVRRDVAVLKDARETNKEQLVEVKTEIKTTKEKRDLQWESLSLSIAQIKNHLNLKE